MNTSNQFSVVIQAGGQSNRMGRDKALLPFLGKPLILRQVKRLKRLTDQIVVITNHPEGYTFLGLPLYGDHFPGSGPLGGLMTALEVVDAASVAVVACDMPFLSTRLLRAQRDLLLLEGVDVVVPRTAQGLEPLHAVYRTETCLPAVRAALEAGERKMISWYAAVQVREMPPDEVEKVNPDFTSFINVNSPEEFREAEEKAAREPEL